jgi:hypothetical protein
MRLKNLSEEEIIALKEAWKRIIWQHMKITIDSKVQQAFDKACDYELESEEFLTVTFDAKTNVGTLLVVKNLLLEKNY